MNIPFEEFTISDLPMYGEIVDLNGFNIEEFKSSDAQIIFYKNDGSERPNDKFSVRATDSSVEYMVNVSVKLINDPPDFSVNPGVFQPIEGFSNLLTKEFLSISDPDSDPVKVIIYILGQYASPSIDDHTYLHTRDHPRRPLKSFNLKQLQENQIFVKQKVGESEYRLIFKAKDEYDTSMMQILYTKPVKLEIFEEKNKLIEARQGGEFLFSNEDFLYRTNAPSNEIEISYEVLDIPELGELLFLDNENNWVPAEFFSQKDIASGRLKYIHDLTKDSEDSEKLKLRVLADNIDYGDTAEIKIKILKVDLKLKVASLDIHNESTIVLDETLFNIEARSIGGQVLERNDIKFCFTTLPILSEIAVNGTAIRANQLIPYNDVISRAVKIFIKKEIRKQVVDVLPVKIKMDALEQMTEFRLNYLPDPEKVFVVNNALNIEEGQ